jgi:branched-subunit amino acid transport protein
MTAEYLAIIVGMGVVTYGPRWFPLLFLARRRMPSWLIEWLDFIPASILSALVVPYLVTSGEPRHLDVFRPELFVALPTFAFAVKTKSLAGTVVVGMFLFWFAGMYLQ